MSTMETGPGERQRILEMVQTGAVTPEEGERLLSSLEQRIGQRQRCPYCAEDIPANVGICPECQTTLATASQGARPPQGGSGFHSLRGLGKFLVIYTFLVCGVALLLNTSGFGFMGVAFLQKVLAILGIVGAVMLCKGVGAGRALCILWAALQIIPFAVNGVVLNRQFLHVGIMSTSNGSGLGFNVVGLALLILFIKAVPSADACHRKGV
jgi:hypothetical protein